MGSKSTTVTVFVCSEQEKSSESEKNGCEIITESSSDSSRVLSDEECSSDVFDCECGSDRNSDAEGFVCGVGMLEAREIGGPYSSSSEFES